MPPELQRVVVGVDFTPSALEAAQWTASHFAPGAQVILVHTVELSDPPGFLREPFPQLGTLAAEAEAAADSRLRELAASLRGTHVDTRIARGRPAEQLLRIVHETNADLVVVGRHNGQGIWERLGSTAEALVRSSSVPVLVTTGRVEKAPGHLLAAVDYDDLTTEVLLWTAMLAERFTTDVTVVHVVSNAALTHVLSLESVKTGKERFSEEEIRTRFRDEADHWMQRVMDASLHRHGTQCEILFGEAAGEIVKATRARDADLILLGRRGKAPLRRFLLGGVVREVLRTAPCPVLVVVEPEDEVLPPA